MPRSLFVPRLARRVATEPRGGGPRRTGTDHRVGHASVAATDRTVVDVAASRLRDHAAPRSGHQAHVVAARPDAGLQGPSAENDGPVHGPRAGRLGRGSRHHLQSGTDRPAPVRRGHRRRSRRGLRHSGAHRRRSLGRHHSARSPRRRHHHQESRPRPNTRYPVTVGRQIGSSRRVAPPHGEHSDSRGLTVTESKL